MKTSTYEIHIQPTRGWLKLDWHEFWAYRDLLVLMIQRDITSRYKQTLLGPLWFVLQPLLMTAVFAIVFGKVAGIPTNGIPGPLFYLCNLIGWNYFSQNITSAGASFVTNAHLFGKVYFPRLIVPIAIIAANIVAVIVQFIPFLLFLGYYEFFTENGTGNVHFTWRLLLVALPLLQMGVLSLGVSLWMSALTAKFRDLIHLNQFLIQIWMFGTPVIYPISQAISKLPAHWQWVVWVNPMSVPIEAFRLCLLGNGTLGWKETLFSILLTMFLCVTGIAAFQKVERTVIDSV